MTDSHESDSATPETSADATPNQPASDKSISTLNPRLWLAAGLFAAVCTTLAAQYTLSNQAVMTSEYGELAEMMTLNEEQNARFFELQNIADNENEQLLMATVGAAFAAVFGLFAGIIHRKPVMGIVGAIVGVGLAIGISQVASQWIIDLQKPARMEGGDVSAILMHAAQWLLIGASTVVAVSVASLSLMSCLRATAAVLLAAIFGSLLYVTIGMILDPMNRTGNATPAEGMALYLWTAIPPIVAGAILARAPRVG